MTTDKTIIPLRNAEYKINRHLFLICGVITVFTMAMLASEFFSKCEFPSTKIPIFYLGVLIIYSLHKELVRWLGEKKAERQGEYFVYAWIAFTLFLYVVSFVTKQYFVAAEEGECSGPLITSCVITLEVLAIFLITRTSKFIKLFFNGKNANVK